MTGIEQVKARISAYHWLAGLGRRRLTTKTIRPFNSQKW
jgi:hypothetical protein